MAAEKGSDEKLNSDGREVMKCVLLVSDRAGAKTGE